MKKNFLITTLLATSALFFISRGNDHALTSAQEKKGSPQKTIFLYQQAIEKNQEDWNAHYNLGIIFAHQRDYENAIKHFQAIISKNPESITALYNLAYCQRHNHLLHEALATYNTVLALNNNHQDAHLGKAGTLLSLGQFETAWNEFEYRLDNWQEFHQYFKYPSLNLSSLASKKNYSDCRMGTRRHAPVCTLCQGAQTAGCNRLRANVWLPGQTFFLVPVY